MDIRVDGEDIKITEYANEDLTQLDFTDDGQADPLNVHDFFQSPKVKSFQENKLTSIWAVRYKEQLVGYFTLSMFAISTSIYLRRIGRKS
jgi:DNA-binding MltR family transcriptional regulator